jgi:alpha-beta hydrolase superfamily lysophospholipase
VQAEPRATAGDSVIATLNQQKYLFLHYGPGGNADLERFWLKDIEGVVDFWNQPQLSGAECTFDHLLACVVEKYDSGNYGGIVAHSFGCDLALNALNRVQNPVNQLILISPIRDLPKSFLAFGEKLMGAAKCSELRRLIESREANRGAISPEEIAAFWMVVGGIVAEPIC